MKNLDNKTPPGRMKELYLWTIWFIMEQLELGGVEGIKGIGVFLKICEKYHVMEWNIFSGFRAARSFCRTGPFCGALLPPLPIFRSFSIQGYRGALQEELWAARRCLYKKEAGDNLKLNMKWKNMNKSRDLFSAGMSKSSEMI